MTRVAGKEYKGSTLKVTQDRGVQSRVAIAFLPKSYTTAEVTALLQDVAEPADIHLSQPGPWPHYCDAATHAGSDAVHGTIVATVTLRDAPAAQRTVDRLHQMPLEGHKLVATLIKPGAR